MSTNQEKRVLRLGARGSLLSRMQSEMVARELEAAHGGQIKVELVVVQTSGDRIQDRPLYEFGGKGLFTKELELALLRGDVDFAVHSYKDVPVTMPLVEEAGRELVMAAVPMREDPRDVLVSVQGRSLAELPAGARVGTGSLRRQAQVLAARGDMTVLPIRGNVDTRLRKWREGEYDAVIVAMAGVRRAGLFDAETMTVMAVDEMLPAAGQGALAVQCRRDADGGGGIREILGVLHDQQTARAVEMEREVVRLLNGDCHSPIGALAMQEGERGEMRLRVAVAGREGRPPVVRAEVVYGKGAAEKVVGKLRESGGLAAVGMGPPFQG